MTEAPLRRPWMEARLRRLALGARARRWLSLGVSCSCWLAVATASAQPAATTPAAAAEGASAAPASAAAASGKSRAGALIEQGMAARREGRDEAALAAFEEASTLDPESARASVHLAAAHQALGHWLEADALLEELLQRTDDPYVERHHATLLRAREFVSRHLGTLLIVGEPAGAVVKVNGRRLGTLPLTAPLRLAVGSYQLEVTRAGYYPLQRPITISAGGTLRESAALAPLSEADAASSSPRAAAEPSAGVPRWLAWTTSGLAAGALVTTAVAWGVRNHHASHWNSSSCLEPGRLRRDVCPNDRDAGKRAEQLAYIGGVATVLLTAGAVLSWTLLEAPASDAPAGLALRCGLTLGQAECAGSF